MNRPLALLLCFALLFGIGLFAKPDLFGADPYYYFSFSCGKIGSLAGKGIFAETIFSFLPCSFLAWKIVQLALILFASIVLGYCGIALFGKKGFWVAPLSWFALILPNTFAKLEPMNFALPFCFLGLYFVLKKKNWQAFASLVLAGAIWKGTIVWLFLMGFLFWPFFLLAVPVAFTDVEGFIGSVYSRTDVAESLSITGLNMGGVWVPIPVIMLPLFFFLSFRIWRLENEEPEKGLLKKLKSFVNLRIHPKLFYATVFSLMLAGFAYKWAILALPFLALHFSKSFLEKNRIDKYFIVGLTFFFVIGSALLIPLSIPTTEQVEGVKKAVALSEDGNVQNDWSTGHWILFYDGIPSSQFGPPTKPFVCDYRPVLTQLDLNADFELVFDSNYYFVYQCKK